MSDNSKAKTNNPALQKKLMAAKNPDSIFLPNYLAFQLRMADRIIVDIRRRVAISLPVEQAKEYINEIVSISAPIWELVFKLIPKLATNNFEPRRWREIGDSYEVKVRQANRKAMSYIIPRTEEIGQMAMAFRLIAESMMIMRQKASLEEIEDAVTQYTSLTKNFITLLQRVAVEAGVNRDIIDKLMGKGRKKRKPTNGNQETVRILKQTQDHPELVEG